MIRHLLLLAALVLVSVYSPAMPQSTYGMNQKPEQDTLTVIETEEMEVDAFGYETQANTVCENPYRFKGTELIVPGALLTAGVVGLESRWLKKINREIKDGLQGEGHGRIRIDNFTPFVPIVGTYGLNLLGVKGKNSIADVTIIYGTTYLLLAATLFPMKDFIRSERPNQKDFNSFPSGHTAIAFAAAEVMRREYWDVSPWIGVAGYVFAVGTGFLRMYNNAHWLTDVLGGAGLGILCAEAAYWLYPAVAKTFFKKQFDANVYLAPQISTSHFGMACSITF